MEDRDDEGRKASFRCRKRKNVDFNIPNTCLMVVYTKGRTEMNEELELYKLVMGQTVADARWIDENNFCIWIYHFSFADFMKQLVEIFGSSSLFGDGGFDARVREDYICINLSQLLENRVDVTEVFREG